MTLKELISRNRLTSLLFVCTALAALAHILVVNRTMNPSSTVIVSHSELELQFAFTPENGMRVLQSWGPGATGRYLSVIWIDVLFALFYGPFFYLLIRALGGGLFWATLPVLDMLANFVETSLEIYWVTSHTPDNPLFAPFFIHSIVASFKWFLVPVYWVYIFILLRRAYRNMQAAPSPASAGGRVGPAT
jgi:hypothetical protein